MKKQEIESLLKNSTEVSELMGKLAHPIRLQILCSLVDGKKSVTELAEFCNLSQPSTSQFLARMKKGGLVNSERAGRTIFYGIVDPRLIELLSVMKKIFCKG